MDTWNSAERRSSQERRAYSTWTLVQCALSPRRMSGRRKTDRRYAMLDRFDSGMLALAVLLMALSITDSVLTLTLISRGGSEINPFMNALLQHSVWLFAGVKMLLTAIPAIVLVATGNLLLFNRWRARSILAAMVGLYLGLIGYELILISLS
ncbi:MAG: hypothetical protein HKN42_03430 [Granulosicoccus sp.]|nr:hypothetical protein [Granulosicoccus sp.]